MEQAYLFVIGMNVGFMGGRWGWGGLCGAGSAALIGRLVGEWLGLRSVSLAARGGGSINSHPH